METNLAKLTHDISGLVRNFIHNEVSLYKENYDYMLNSPLFKQLREELIVLRAENIKLSKETTKNNIELEIKDDSDETLYEFDRKYHVEKPKEVVPEEDGRVESHQEEVTEEEEDDGGLGASPQEEDGDLGASPQEEEEEEVIEFEYKGVQYFVTNEENGDIYANVDDDIGDLVGKIENKNVILF